MPDADIAVLRPRIACVHRQDARGLSVGDEAEAVLAPGLLQLLTLRDGAGVRLDEGLCAEWMIPMSAGAAAMYAVLRPLAYPQAAWSSARVSFRWTRPAQPGEACAGRARIDSLGRTSAHVSYAVVGAGDGDACGAGDSTMVYVPSGKPSPIDALCASYSGASHRDAPGAAGAEAPTVEDVMGWHPRLAAMDASGALSDDPAAASEGAVFRLRRPRCVARFVDRDRAATAGDTWVWWFAPDLLRMLMHPMAGMPEPLGREFHPAARISNGSMVYAAQWAAGEGYDPAHLTARYRNAPLDARSFALYSRVASADAAGIVMEHALFQSETIVADGSVTFRRSQGRHVEYVAPRS